MHEVREISVEDSSPEILNEVRDAMQWVAYLCVQSSSSKFQVTKWLCSLLNSLSTITSDV